MSFACHNFGLKWPIGALLLIFACSSLPAAAQASLNTPGASNCVAADFDANLEFAYAHDDFLIFISKRNLADHACVFDPAVHGPDLMPYHTEGHEPYKICYFCETRLPNGEIPVAPVMTLEPGNVIWQTVRWKTKPASDSMPCQQVGWRNDSIWIAAPSILPPVCSDVEVSRFSLLAPHPLKNETNSPSESHLPQLILSSSKSSYDRREEFTLHLSRARLEKDRPDDSTCPTIYLKHRLPDGTTSISEEQPLAFKGCKQNIPGYEPGDWKSGFELDPGLAARVRVGKHEIQMLQLMSASDEPWLRFASSNTLNFNIVDPTTLPRRWGPRVKGIAADVTLDKTHYRLGEDVPLHLAIADFEAQAQLYSWDGSWDPCMVIGIEVQDETGHALPVNQRFHSFSVCQLHGLGPVAFPKGKVVPLERTLRGEGWLPNRTGTYTIKIRWQPSFSPSGHASNGVPNDLQTYATATATAKMQVLTAP